MDSSKLMVTASLVTLAAATLTYWMYCKKPCSQKFMETMVARIQNLDEVKDMKWERVGRVAKLLIYPVKSFAPTVVEAAQAERYGLASGTLRDRNFMVTSEKGQMVTGRMVRQSVLVKPTFHHDTLTLTFPGTPDLNINLTHVEASNNILSSKVWDSDVVGLDCGDECAQWLEEVLGCKCRLLYHASLPVNRSSYLTRVSEKFPLLRHDDQSLYADLTGYMLITAESIADLQTRVPECPLDPVNFRPSILVEGTPKPYHEDTWKYIRIGDVVFRNVKPCTRCIFTTIDTRTGKKDPNMEPLRTLRKYRCFSKVHATSPCFGINLGLDIPGLLREGDEVFITMI